VRECRRPRKNGPSREELSKQAFSLASGFREPEGIKTPLIIAPYCILSRLLVSEYPPLKRLFGRFLRKWPRRQIEIAVSMSSEKGRTSSCLSREHTVAAKSPEADGYVDNSPLRSELTTYPQPLLPDQRKEEDITHSHIYVGYPQAVACGSILQESSGRLRVDNPEKRRQKPSKRGRVWQPSIDAKLPLCYYCERGNWMGL
jgi:hypothetical protein